MSILLDGKAIPIQSLLFVFSVAAASLTCHGDWPSTSWNLKPFLQPWNTFLIFKKLNYECILIWFPYNVNVADVNNGRRLNPSYRCWMVELFVNGWIRIPKSMGMSQLHKPPLQWAGECGSMPCSVAYNLAVSPPILFLFSIYHGIVGIYMEAAGRTGEELTKCKIITITRLISPIFRSLSAENVFPLQKQPLKWWTNGLICMKSRFCQTFFAYVPKLCRPLPANRLWAPGMSLIVDAMAISWA